MHITTSRCSALVLVIMCMMLLLCCSSTTTATTAGNNYCLFDNTSPFNNKKIDLSALYNETFVVEVQRPSDIPSNVDTFAYTFSFCSVAQQDTVCAGHLNSSLCQYWTDANKNPTTLAKSIGSFVQEPRPEVEALYNTSSSSSPSEQDLYGYTITFRNGDDDCWFSPQQPAIPRTTHLHILCPTEGMEPSNVIQLQDYLPTRCTYNATLYHPIACPNTKPNYCLLPHTSPKQDANLLISLCSKAKITSSPSPALAIPRPTWMSSVIYLIFAVSPARSLVHNTSMGHFVNIGWTQTGRMTWRNPSARGFMNHAPTWSHCTPPRKLLMVTL